MKIKNITLTNFIGINGTSDFECKELTLFCGPNGSGKSRIADAIAFALTGELCRGVTKKKDFGLLITSGQKKASVEIEFDALTVDRVLPDNQSTMSGDGAILNNEFLPYCLDMHKFGAMEQDSRREFLMRLTGVKTDTGSIKKRMIAMSCDPDKTEIIAPMVRAGFEQAETSAKDEARQEKANWRAVTGKTWSPGNGEDWKPEKIDVPKLQLDPAEFDQIMDKKQAEIQKLISKQAKIDAALKIQSNPYFNPATQDKMRNEVDRLNNELLQIQARCKKGEEHIKDLSEKSNELGQFLFLSTSLQCPECGTMLAIDESDTGTTELKKIENYPGTDAEEKDASQIKDNIREVDEKRKSAVALLAELGAEKLLKMERLHNTSAKLTQYKHSELVLRQSLDDGQEISEQAAKAIAKNLKDGKAEYDAIGARYRAWEHAERERKSADEKSKKAAMHHANVMQWLHIADALSPSGIPQQLVSDALQTVNAEISTSCAQIGLDQMSIESDMSIKYRYRPYHLLSESEQWRVDMVCTVVIAKLSGISIVVLDRLDILDLRSRQMIMKWLSEQHKKMQSIVLATLKAPLPSNDWISCHWLGDK